MNEEKQESINSKIKTNNYSIISSSNNSFVKPVVSNTILVTILIISTLVVMKQMDNPTSTSTNTSNENIGIKDNYIIKDTSIKKNDYDITESKEKYSVDMLYKNTNNGLVNDLYLREEDKKNVDVINVATTAETETQEFDQNEDKQGTESFGTQELEMGYYMLNKIFEYENPFTKIENTFGFGSYGCGGGAVGAKGGWPLEDHSHGRGFIYDTQYVNGVARPDLPKKLHTGVDFSRTTGTIVYAHAAGTVVATIRGSSGYGNHIKIDHGGGKVTWYAHLSSIDVTEGSTVAAGAPIGKVGSTGNSTGPHLHFEVRIDNVPKDPLLYLNDSTTTEATPTETEAAVPNCGGGILKVKEGLDVGSAPSELCLDKLIQSGYLAIASEASKLFNVDPFIILAVMRTESSFESSATSGVGAQGLMQVMPATFQSQINTYPQLKAALGDNPDPHNPRASILVGTAYLFGVSQADWIRGDKFKTWAGYNAGSGCNTQSRSFETLNENDPNSIALARSQCTYSTSPNSYYAQTYPYVEKCARYYAGYARVFDVISGATE